MRRLHSGGYRHFYHLFDLSKNHQNHGFYSLWGLLTYLTTIKLIKIFLHANSELCSSHTALFQTNFVIFSPNNDLGSRWGSYFASSN